MTKTLESDRAELIQTLHRAARIERAEAVQMLLRKLLQRSGEARAPLRPAWPAPGQPAAGHCR
jgi:hypothetical protein